MPDRKRTIEVDFLVDDSDKRKLKGIGDEADTTTGKFDGLKGAVGGFLTVAAAQQLGAFIVDVAKIGEQAGIAAESASKVLGPALDGLRSDLDEVRGAMGLNQAETDGLIAKLGLLTDGMGLTDDAQAEFIGWLIQTGGELAAFKGDLGLSQEAVEALGKAVNGETDMLENFGIKLSDAAIEEEKLRLKAEPANAALSDQQLELLALQTLITEKAAPAIGSLTEAEEGLAGQTNEATTRYEDLKIALGQELLPVVNNVLQFLLETADAWDRLADPETFQSTQLAKWLRDFDSALGPIDELIGDLRDSWLSFEQTVEDVAATVVGKNREFGVGVGGKPTIPASAGRQHGGPVHSGNPYLVGEAGPELFIPSANGKISPAGGTVNNITIHAGFGADPNAIAKQVVQALQRYQRSNGAIPIAVSGRR
jgi:phage-related minor tail protein